MTTPVAKVGVLYDGVDVQSSDLEIFLEIVKGLNESPTVRGKDTIVPALAGRVERNRLNDVIAIELRGFVRADPTETTKLGIETSFRANVQIVRALFASNRGRAVLVCTLEDASVLSISAAPLPGIIWNERIPGEYAEVSIPLEGYDDWAAEVIGS